MKMGLDMDERRYEEISGMDKLVAILDEYLSDYNASSPATMNIVFFRDAVEHIVRMCRILRQPRGNALLIGVGGSGKSSMAKFAAHIGDFQCFSIVPGRSYGLTEFREDMKSLYTQVRADSASVCVQLTSSSVTFCSPNFLQCMILQIQRCVHCRPDSRGSILCFCSVTIRLSASLSLKTSITCSTLGMCLGCLLRTRKTVLQLT
jgi:P-loop containing dynein motor region D4